jgi:nucleotide-binding universal stress UspA family protein
MKRIVVGLDASPRASDVLATAVALAKSFGAKLVLVRAVTIPVELPVQALSMAPEQVGTLLEKDAREALGRIGESLPPELRGGERVVIGTPWQVVCEAGKKEDADLIVVGSHGYGVIDRVLGTTAAKVVNHADRSVLVVRGGKRVVA